MTISIMNNNNQGTVDCITFNVFVSFLFQQNIDVQNIFLECVLLKFVSHTKL